MNKKLLSTVLAIFLSSCGANNGLSCSAPVATLSLENPPNGGTGVSTSGGSMSFAVVNLPIGDATLPATLRPVTLTAPSGASSTSGALQNSGDHYTATLPNLLSLTTYTVVQTVIPSALGCSSAAAVGSFTTQ